MNKFASEVVNRRGLYFFGTLFILSLMVMTGLTHVGFSTDSEIFFNPNDEMVLSKKQFEEDFHNNYVLAFLIKFDERGIYDADAIRYVNLITDEAELLPHARRVDSLARYQHIETDDDGLYISSPIENKQKYDETDVSRLRTILNSDTKLRQYLINKDENLTIAIVHLNILDGDESKKIETYHAAKEIISKYKKLFPHIDTKLSGQLAFDRAVEEVASRDAMNVELPMLVLILVLMWVAFRSVRAALAGAAVIIGSILSAVSGAGLIGYELNASNIMSIYLIMFLAIMDCVHLLSSYQSNLASSESRKLALIKSFETNMEGLFFTSVTTIIGFLSLVLLDSPAFFQLGVIGAMGIATAFILTLFVLPTIMLFRVQDNQSGDEKKTNGHAVVTLPKYVFQNNRRKVLWLSVLLVFLVCPFAVKNYYNDVPIDMFKQHEEVRIAHDLATTEFSGMLSMNYVLDSGEAEGIYDIKYLTAVQNFRSWLESQNEIQKVRDFTDVIKNINKTLHNNDPAFDTLPPYRDEVSQYALLYEMSLPYGASVSDQVDMHNRKLNLEIYTSDLSGVELIELHKRINEYLVGEAAFHYYYSTSYPLIFAYIGHNNIFNLSQGWILALTAIFICMILVTRSVKMGVITMVPNIIPILITYGIWGLFYQELTIISMVLILGVGVVVDDTIHFTVQFRKNCLNGMTVDQSILAAFDVSGKAIVMSTFLMVSGFMVPVLFGDFVVNNIGYLMLSILLLSAMFFDLFVFPSILKISTRE